MRILFLSTWFPFPPDNGSKIRVKYLIQALGERHEVTLLSFAFQTAQPEAAQGLSCKTIRTIAVNPFMVNQTSDLKRFLSKTPVIYRPIGKMQRLVQETLRASSFDVLIASTELMATYALQAKSEKTMVLEEHNSLTQQMRERYENSGTGIRSIRNWLSWQKTRRYEGQLFNQFDLVTMVSRQDKETSEHHLKGFTGPVALVPNEVDCVLYKPGSAIKKPHQLILKGSLTYQANYDVMAYFLSQIYPLIRAQIPSVELLITGSTSSVDLENLALDETVVLTGFVADIQSLVAESAVCVVSLRQGGGSRLKILEAMALGTAVVSTSKGAEGLAVVDGKHLIIADEAHDFANKVVALLRSTASQERLSVNARELVEENYDWRQIGERFVNLLEDKVNSAPAGQAISHD